MKTKKEAEDAEETPEGDEAQVHEEDQPSLLKRTALIVIGVIVLLLFLSYFFLGPHTIDIIESLMVSSEIDDFTVEGEGFSVVFEPAAYDKLRDVYYQNKGNEFKACLFGSVSSAQGGDVYRVSDVFLPEQRGTYAQVSYRLCPAETIVSLHSQPYRRCVASKQDFRSFESFREKRPDAVMMIMCEEERFYVYR